MGAKADIEVRQATIADIDLLSPLFDGYRQFYGKPGDVALARAFLLERFQHHQSVIFIALDGTREALGFTQLYPSFSSVSAARTFILNDLFVVAQARRRHVGAMLLEAASTFGQRAGAIRLSLSTATDNDSAQALYAANGWVRDTGFYEYTLPLST
jgi:ribosomal protein S18 acetylase RimI-like enzyme